MDLNKLKEELAKDAYNMTVAQAKAQGICICCKKPPTFYSEPGRREYQITALCEPCFDKLADEGE